VKEEVYENVLGWEKQKLEEGATPKGGIRKGGKEKKKKGSLKLGCIRGTPSVQKESRW